MAIESDTPVTPGPLPATLHVVRSAQLTPSSLAQVKQAIAPVVQQLVQASGLNLSATELQELNQAFMERGVISIPATAAAGHSLNIEATSLTYLE